MSKNLSKKIQKDETIEILNKTRAKLPRLAFLDLKNKILGKKYNLSIVFLDLASMKKFSTDFKEDDTHTNILTFPYSKNDGEILLCPTKIKTDAKKFGMNFEEHLLFLTIHGLLHLNGMSHGSIMENKEEEIWREFTKQNSKTLKFKNGKKHYHRN